MSSDSAINNNTPKWLIDFGKTKKEHLVRGKTPDDIEARCLELVQSYIGGSWNNATSSTNDITVERISGGFTNQLYRVKLKDSVPRKANPVYADEPTEVAIKLYQEKHVQNYNKADPERLNDTIILNVMSQSGLGPTVYGIFENGFIQAYHAHEQFRAKHQEDSQLCRQLMKLLVTISNLKVPIRKETDLGLKAYKDLITYSYKHYDVQRLARKLKLKLITSTDLLAELEKFAEKIKQLGAPIVFSHNDYTSSNVLVISDGSSKEKTFKLILVDLEHAGYGARGFDIASIFSDWGKKELLDMNAKPPTNDDLKMLVKLYIEVAEELEPGYAAKERNSFEQHMKEARLMILFRKFIFVAFLLGQKESYIATVPLDRKTNLEFAEVCLDDYMKTKKDFIQKGYY